VDVWSSAWPNGDVDAIAALYADDAVFYSHPFRDRETPHEYVAWVFAEQADAECRFGVPVVEGARAAVDWWAAIRSADGSVDGLVVEQRDVWVSVPGRHELADWAGSPGPPTIPRS
jgi:hypothetical protein